ncbi:MAG: hypothetical protein HZA13_10715 [Nitrospirae bacterium]|nr:hypothetical protein [Nitrospirota bacterium]
MVEKRTYADRREYLIGAVKKRRKKIRQRAIDYLGGQCNQCSYDRCGEALEFHHLESSEKDFGISNQGYTRSWKRVEEELKKCILLCANCHREVHASLQLLRETAVEKSGEFRETLKFSKGNPERSSLNGDFLVSENVQRLRGEDLNQ